MKNRSLPFISVLSAFPMVLALGLANLPSVCAADELDEIQRARETAEMQYVNELSTGKYKTQKERDELKSRLLGPQEERSREYFKRISTPPPPKGGSAAGGSTREADSNGESDLMSGSPRVNRSKSSDGYSASYESLDGSNVPKQLIFEPSHPKAKASPSPKSSAKGK
jgi:hypothetical protein